ncbi:carbohydrate kinase [Maribellus sp. YY47]|uniref:carbohydrate kinase family protein n=1 Tax=Maribellus sp. YY47 TaxID=2929486 RepID=UPI00200086DC|nr:carbohydrate kinase [Maribellus sp. YY47]MCK3685567.1 carbohydrate kinase [Maribellus sp. YY47]
MTNKYKIAGIGEILWDILPQGKVLGGAPGNFAYHAAMLGADGYIFSAVGNDGLGREIISRLSGYNIHLQIETLNYPTGVVDVTLNEAGIPQYEITEQVAWDFIPFSAQIAGLAKQMDAVCFGSLAQRSEISKASITKFVSLVPDSALKVFDINLRQHYYSKTLITESMQLANVLKINDEELRTIADMYELPGDDLLVCRQLAKEFNLKMVACTYGANGSLLCSLSESSFMETPQVAVKDTVGAGDAFSAALIVGILNGFPMKRCHEMAVQLSAYVCTQDGAMPKYDYKTIKTELHEK